MEIDKKGKYNMAMRYFTDCHFHVMTLKEPNFASFLNSFYASPQDIITGNAAENYILSPKLLRGDTLLNMLTNAITTFDRPIGETFCLMEDDLSGRFSSPSKKSYAPAEPFIKDGKLHIRGEEYEKMFMIPLLMDFSQSQKELDGIYYTYPAEDKITPYIEATVEGMRYYYEKRPDGLFEFYPFAGINPVLHSFEFLKDFLRKYINTAHEYHGFHEIPEKPFYGIKVYPPLGFDPWPNDYETLRKHRYLYEFCEDNDIPIITHCDDQGFRGVPAKEAWKYTDPASWRTVLENYPHLKLDLAHFGRQYAISADKNIFSLRERMKMMPSSPWFKSAAELMLEFDGVYSDLSFSGCQDDFYIRLSNYIDALDAESREKFVSRILFGSDFSINLLKVESYTEYYSIISRSILSDELIRRFSEDNIKSFLVLNEKQKKSRFIR